MKIEIYSHQRAGTHWLAWLVARNFLKTDNYVPLIKNHGLISESRIKPDIKYLYIRRGFEDTAKSIYDMRSRFGLDEDDYGKFKSRKCSDMFNPGMKSEVTWDTDSEAGNKMIASVGDSATKVSSYYKDIDSTLQEWHYAHMWHYYELAVRYSNIYIVSYENLVEKFQDTMFDIYCFIFNKTPQLTEKPEFINSKKRVGWHAKK